MHHVKKTALVFGFRAIGGLQQRRAEGAACSVAESGAGRRASALRQQKPKPGSLTSKPRIRLHYKLELPDQSSHPTEIDLDHIVSCATGQAPGIGRKRSVQLRKASQQWSVSRFRVNLQARRCVGLHVRCSTSQGVPGRLPLQIKTGPEEDSQAASGPVIPGRIPAPAARPSALTSAQTGRLELLFGQNFAVGLIDG